MPSEVSDVTVQFRIQRAAEFTRQWWANANRLKEMIGTDMPALVRSDALNEAHTARDIVARRAGEMEGLAAARGYGEWAADPVVSPAIKDLRALIRGFEEVAAGLQADTLRQ